MRRLGLIIFFLSFSLNAKEILSEEDLKDKFISVVKDNEIETKLQNSSEIQECIKSSKFDPKDNDQQRKKKAEDAEKCFGDKLGKQDPEKLKELADQFQLESFGLIKNKTTKEITEYFTDKLHKAMTGVDRKAKRNEESLKFKNRKLVDQEDFIKLYSNHLTQSVLFEISKYCFENLRNAGATSTTSFAEHWGNFDLTGPVTDLGNGEFSKNINTTDTKSSYDGIFKGIVGNGTIPTQKLNDFFKFCMAQIPKLCETFEKCVKDGRGNCSLGSNSCLVKSKLQEARKVVNDTKKIEELFKKDLTGGTSINLGDDSPQHFRASGENSYINLSSITSYDILEGGKLEDDERLKLAEKCSKEPEDPDCEKFIVIDDSKNKSEFNADLAERLKKVAEIKKIKELDNKNLEEYLKEQGYLELAEKAKSGALNKDEIANEIEKIFNAKREATLSALSSKIGKRQMTEEEANKKDNSTDPKKSAIQENAEEVVKERARMSQVVLFNNILTSFVEATEEKTNKVRKFGATWKKEQESLENDAKGKVDESLFAGFEQSFDDNSGSEGGESANIDSLLNAVLGGKDEQNKTN